MEARQLAAMDEPPNDVDQLVGSFTARVEGEEPVVLASEHDELDRLRHRRQPSGIILYAVVQHVQVRVHDEHRREGDVVQRVAVRPERVGRRVVPGRADGQRHAPHLLQQLCANELMAIKAGRLGRRSLLGGEVGPEQDAPGEPDDGVVVEGQLPPAVPDGDVVRDVAAGRVAADEHPAQVGRVGEPRVGLGLGAQPRQDGLGVAVRRGEAVLGRQAVVGGEHERRELGGEAERAGVEVGQLEAAEAEAAAVEVDEHRQLVVGRRRRRVAVGGPVHAEAERVCGVVDDVFPLDGQVGRHLALERERGVVRGARHGAVAKELHDAEAVVHDVRRRG